MAEMEVLALRRRNEELERALKASCEREEALRRDLDRAMRRLTVAEEAEERLCSQLGDLEAESAYQAQSHRLQMKALVEKLSCGQPSALVVSM